MTADVEPGKRGRASGHFIDHHAEGKQIGTRIEFLATSLFRRHVGNRADGAAGTGEIVVVRMFVFVRIEVAPTDSAGERRRPIWPGRNPESWFAHDQPRKYWRA